MTDLYFALALIAALSGGLFLLALRLGKKATTRVNTLMALGTVCAIFLYVQEIHQKALLARILPFSNLMVLGNWFPLAGAFLGGLAWRLIPGSARRKCVTLVPLASVCLYASYWNFIGDLPPTVDVWQGDVALQSTDASCSPACAATLLTAYGISAGETEMAQLSLTRDKKGTTWFGLYRGLKKKTEGTPYDVEIFNGSLDDLIKAGGPMILSVRLDNKPGIDPRYEAMWHWTVNQQHAVVLWKIDRSGIVSIGDPSIGREFWSLKAIEDLWHGEGMRLVKRK